jgi:Fur family ferric uptake transcriptional regulator
MAQRQESPTLDDVLGRLRQAGYRMTPQRRAIVAEVVTMDGHISAPAVARKVQASMPGVDHSTVYRTLDLLEELGVLSHSHLERGPEYHRVGEARHVHLTCSSCGRQDDLSADEVTELERTVQRHHGFMPDMTHFAISGLCAKCQARPGASSRR